MGRCLAEAERIHYQYYCYRCVDDMSVARWKAAHGLNGRRASECAELWGCRQAIAACGGCCIVVPGLCASSGWGCVYFHAAV